MTAGKRQVAIVGTSPSWKDAPFENHDWEIWSCNAPALDLPRCDRIFEIHRRWWDNEQDNRYLKKLRAVKAPQKVYSIIPIGGTENVVMDRTALFEKYGVTWFSSSFGYMLGQAFDEKVSKIGLWGVDMESREEYVVQQAGVRHFIDIAKLVGVEIVIPDDSMLRRQPAPYPDRFETVQALVFERRAQRIHKLIEDAEDNLENAKRWFYRHEGRIASEKGDELGDEEGKVHYKLERRVLRWTATVGRLKGGLWATQHYKRLFVWNILDPDPGDETDADIEDCGPV